MLLHPTIEKLTSMRFTGMASALEEQMKMDDIKTISFEEHLGLLLDHEQAVRETRRLKTRLSKAKQSSVKMAPLKTLTFVIQETWINH